MEYLIYDGACGFCNKMVMFVAKNDSRNQFLFVSSLSEKGKSLLEKHQVSGLEESTIILLENDRFSVKSLAVQKILLKLPKFKFAGLLMYLFPITFSDFFYDIIAKHRKKIIRNNNCEIPNTEIRKKFIN